MPVIFHKKDQKTNGVPGPGYYPVETIINGKGSHSNSKYRSHLPKMIVSPSLSTSKSFDHSIYSLNSGTPGPGTYEGGVIVNGTRAILSNKKSINSMKFTVSKRNWIDINNTSKLAL